MKFLLTLLLTSLALFTSVAEARSTYIPRECYKYRNDLIREAKFVHGLEAPVSLLAAQIHQESACRATAKSAYAAGLTQFTPDTAKWISSLFKDLGEANVYDTTWAIRALIRYDLMLFKQNSVAIDTCNQWAFAKTGYNGGQGWNVKDRKKAKAEGKDMRIYWGVVELVNSGRRADFFKENRDYPRKIILKHQIQYHKDGWGGPLICSNLISSPR